MRKLTVDDIVDLRAYERERDEFRRRIIELKRTRRVALGPIMTIVFENTDTMRWQVQEMARAERMLRDEQIAHEVETYNQLIPDAGRAVGHAAARAHLRGRSCASGCRKLVGIERHVAHRAARRQRRCAARRPTRTRRGSPATTPPRRCTS